LKGGGAEATHKTLKGSACKRGTVCLSWCPKVTGGAGALLTLPWGRSLLLAERRGRLDAEAAGAGLLLSVGGGGACERVVHVSVVAGRRGTELGRRAHSGSGIIKTERGGELRNASGSAGTNAVARALRRIELALEGTFHCFEVVGVRMDPRWRLRFWWRVSRDTSRQCLLGDRVGRRVIDHCDW
jgi:hypothetical protein